MLVGLSVVAGGCVAGGCAFESQVAVQFMPAAPVLVKESSNPEQIPHRVQGVTTRGGQVVGIDCSISSCSVPHIIGASRTYAEAMRTLSCAR